MPITRKLTSLGIISETNMMSLQPDRLHYKHCHVLLLNLVANLTKPRSCVIRVYIPSIALAIGSCRAVGQIWRRLNRWWPLECCYMSVVWYIKSHWAVFKCWRRIKHENSMLVTVYEGISWWPMDFSHKGPGDQGPVSTSKKTSFLKIS